MSTNFLSKSIPINFMNKIFCRSILPLHWFLNSYFAHFRSIINIFDISIFCPIFFQNIMLQLLFILWKNKVKGAAAPFDFAIYFTSQVHRKEIRKISIFLPIFLQHSMLVFLIEWKKWIKRSGRSKYFFPQTFWHISLQCAMLFDSITQIVRHIL